MSLGFTKQAGETWRECCERYASKWHLQEECLSAFDAYTRDGMDEPNAVWCALGDWDVLDFKDDDK